MDADRAIEKVALLREPIRRKLFSLVRESDHPVSRDEAARAVGVSRSLAAFHLDRLADGGLLEVEYRRLAGRTGRGAGRPAKLYRPGGERVSIAVPPTRYALAGDLLIGALEAKRAGQSAEEAVREASVDRGRELAAELRGSLRGRSGLTRMREAVDRLGFEPEATGDVVRLRNCPFHELVQKHPGVVCGLNEAFLTGLAEGLGEGDVRAEGHPEEGFCCVRLRRERP